MKSQVVFVWVAGNGRERFAAPFQTLGTPGDRIAAGRHWTEIGTARGGMWGVFAFFALRVKCGFAAVVQGEAVSTGAGADASSCFAAAEALAACSSSCLTFSSISLPGLKVTTYFSATNTFSPVRGLRALRAARRLTSKTPKLRSEER